MAGQNRTIVQFERLVERLIGKVRDIQDHADLPHLPEQFAAGGKQPAFGARAVGVRAGSISRADNASPASHQSTSAPAKAPGRPLPCSE